MAALDWVFLTVLAASLLIGAWRGLVFELLSLAGWVVAFFA
ncbi:MAG: CvpA family protein, partial [Alicycliphilus sp.]